MCQICGEGWRVEATDLSTGVVKAVLHPVTAEWSEQYSRPGAGSLMVATGDPSAEDVWPHTTGLYVSRVNIDGTRVGHFGGYIESVAASGAGTTNLGLQSLDNYLSHRLLADDDEGLAYATPGYVDPNNPGPGKSQTEIAKDLATIAVAGTGAVPLVPVAEPSTTLRAMAWAASDFKNIGDAVSEMVDAGLCYRVEHSFREGPARWSTTIRFFDSSDTDRGLVIRSGIEAYRSSLTLDAKDQASRIYGVGSGTGVGQMFSIAYDEDAPLPEFQTSVAWKDVVIPATLDENTRGAVTLRRDPVSTPSATLVGLTDVPPESLNVGDIVSPELGFGVVTFREQKARVTSQAWRLALDEPVTRTLGLDPIIRPSESVKTQVAAKPPVPETPEQEVDPPPETPIEVPAPTYPSQVFDLTIWKLTLPTGSSGKPDEIKQPQLATYTHSQYFHTVAGPGVLFKAPQKGVTTPNSKNTRTELREMKPGGKSNASWSSGTMEAVLAFTHLPSSKPHVVGMQIHDSSDDVTVLRLEGTDLWTTNGDKTHGTKIMSGYQLGTFINVKVVAGGGKITWYLNGAQVAQLSKKVSGGYFKAGAYQQAGNSGSDYGEVIIRSLVVSH